MSTQCIIRPGPERAYIETNSIKNIEAQWLSNTNMIGGRGTGGLLYVYTSNTGWFLRKTYQTRKQKQGINFMRGIGVKELLARGDFPLPATFSSVTSHEWKKSRQAKITGWSVRLGDNVSSKQAIWSKRRLPGDWEVSWPHIIKNAKLIRVTCYICRWYANFDLFFFCCPTAGSNYLNAVTMNDVSFCCTTSWKQVARHCIAQNGA